MRHLRFKYTSITSLACAGLLILTITSSSMATTGVSVEGIDDYSYVGDTTQSGADEAADFYNTLVTTGSPWTGQEHWYNSNVWDADFCDPDMGDSGDNDTSNFDQAGTALAFFSGHGACDDIPELVGPPLARRVCSTALNCNPGEICAGGYPSADRGACITNSPRSLETSSSTNHHSNVVFYGNGHTKWGEDPTTGDWAGAGTNGDINVAFIYNSCGVRWPFANQQLGPMFAGMTQLNMEMPISATGNVAHFSDTYALANRGSLLATNAMMNPNGPVLSGFISTAESEDSSPAGGSCPDMTSDFSHGGGNGVRACGATLTISYDNSASNASWDVNVLTWALARDEGVQSLDNTYYSYFYHCNYDCITYALNN
jgi:hypothetical protein